jgi:hypothetical protein
LDILAERYGRDLSETGRYIIIECMFSAVAVLDLSHGVLLRGTCKQLPDSTDIAVSYISLSIAERHGRDLSETGQYNIIELMFSAVAVLELSHGVLLRGTCKQWPDSTDIAVSYVSLSIAERHGRNLSKTGRYIIINFMFSAVAVLDLSHGVLLRGTCKQWPDSTDVAVSYASLSIAERHGRNLSGTGRYNIIEFLLSIVAVLDLSHVVPLSGTCKQWPDSTDIAVLYVSLSIADRRGRNLSKTGRYNIS